MNLLLLIITIAILSKIIRSINNRHARSRKAAAQRDADRKRIEAREAIQRFALIEREQRIKERLEKEDAKQAEKERLNAFRAKQARDDITHFEQQQRDYLKLYTAAENIANNIDASDRKRQAAFARMIQLDNRSRTIQKQIEKNQYIIAQHERTAN